MKIITHGNTCKEKVCNKCSALLSYCEADIKTESRYDDFFSDQHYSRRKYIICPECNTQIDLSWIIDGEEQVSKEDENSTNIIDREKELREKIAKECLKKDDGKNKWNHNYRISQNDRYDFRGCPDDLEFVKYYTFSALCDEVGNFDCKECWKNFLRGGKC